MISQFFVVSMRGDTILHKDCKSEASVPFRARRLALFSRVWSQTQRDHKMSNSSIWFNSSIGNGELSADHDAGYVSGAGRHHQLFQWRQRVQVHALLRKWFNTIADIFGVQAETESHVNDTWACGGRFQSPTNSLARGQMKHVSDEFQ